MTKTEGERIGSSAHGVDQPWQLYSRALDYIPMATQTHSKAPRPALRQAEPCYIARGI